MKPLRKGILAATLILAIVVPAIHLLAQEFGTFRGSNQRVGRHDGDVVNDFPGRAFLRWFDPLNGVRNDIDNWQPGATWNPFNEWFAPTGIAAQLAIEQGLGSPNPAYRYAFTVASASVDRPNQPVTGQTRRVFTWTLGGTAALQEYQLYVNIPVGPTDINPDPNAVNLAFAQRYYVYEIAGVLNPDNPGQPVLQIVDTAANSGGWVRLGNDGQSTDRIFIADGSGEIRITLVNTVPRRSNGELTDTPGTTVVYADAARFVRTLGFTGTYAASPVVGRLKVNPVGAFPWRVVAARNEPITVQAGGQILNFDQGIVTSYNHNGTRVDPGDDFTGRRNVMWSWPAQRPFAATDSERARYGVDRRNWILGQNPAIGPSRVETFIPKDNQSAGVNVGINWVPETAISNFYGLDYLSQTVDTNAPSSAVVFEPTLRQGNYRLQMWLPGNLSLASQLRVMIFEGVPVDITDPDVPKPGRTVLVVNQTSGNGWVNLQTTRRTRFNHTTEGGKSLRVAITNYSPGTPGQIAYADAIRFVRQSDLRITSSPVMTTARVRTTPNGVPEQRDVVLVSTESGRIYCLDARGNDDGTTNVYWAYPSEVSGADPNHVAGEDGPGGIAENPIGFDLSSALVRVENDGNGQPADRLYIMGLNGRVYCLDMAGRGDFSTSQYGTTRRVWSYPDDYPAPAGAVDSTLGPTVGSISFANTPQGPTIYVPTGQGRVYALNADGDAATKTTSVRWRFPAATDPTLDTIQQTPVVEFGRVYFGAGNGVFYALDATDPDNDGVGNVVWRFPPAPGVGTPFRTSASATTIPAGIAGPSMPNTVIVPGQDGVVYALNADTGAQIWNTAELGSNASASPIFTYLRVFNNVGGLVNAPVVVVPTVSGRFVALFTDVNTTNRAGRRRAWEYQAETLPIVASLAVGARQTTNPIDAHTWMYGADEGGNLYAWSFDPSRSPNDQLIFPGTPPGQEVIVDNDPTNDLLDQIAANAKVVILTPEDYDRIVRLATQSNLRYTDVTTGLTPVTRASYEYGESLRVMVYDLPDPASLPNNLNYVIEMQLTTPASASQRIPVETSVNLTGAPAGRERIAIRTLPLIPIGGNALAPGSGNLTTRVVLRDRQNANRQIGSARPFNLAHPLSVEVRYNRTTLETIGLTTDATNEEVRFNGNLVGDAGVEIEKTIRSSLGPDTANPGEAVGHGQTSTTRFNVYDRSLMTLIWGPTRGISNVRFATSSLAWQGGADAVYKPFNSTFFPNFEELPSQIPNTSADYPDIGLETTRLVKEQFGQVENPIFAPVSLDPPSIAEQALQDYRGAGFNDQLRRTLRPTRFDVETDVPRFQPPNRSSETGALRGYAGSQVVYIDADQPGRQLVGGAREAFREFFLLADVGIDERLRVSTPTIDLGSLPGGAGFLPEAPWSNTTSFSPWNSVFENFFRTFTLLNEGNVNMVNMRVAKFTDDNRTLFPFPLGGFGIHELTWLDAALHLHSDVDPRYAPNGRPVILQKSRVGDVLPNRMSVNPKRRANSALGVQEGFLYDPIQFPPGDPRIGVTAPIGAPVGTYVQDIIVFEDRDENVSFGPDEPGQHGLPGVVDPNVFEPAAEPGFRLRFNVRETRLTNRRTTKAAPMVEEVVSGNEPFYWQNLQPTAVRDGFGNVVVAWASDRLESNNAPGWLPRPRLDTDAGRNGPFYVYVASLSGQRPPPVQDGFGFSPIRDLNAFVPNANNRWFRQAIGPFPTGSPTALFGVGAGETIEPGSLNFTSPTFASSGVFNPLVPMQPDSGRPANNRLYLTFTGEATIRTNRGERRTETRLFVAQVQIADNGSLAVSDPIVMPYDPQVGRSRLTMVQAGIGATVFYATSATGTAQIGYNTFNGADWGRPQTIPLGSGFESLGAPSATLRRRRNTNEPVIDLLFTAKLRGRPTAEAFLGRIRSDNFGRPTGRNPVLFYGTRTEGLILDPATGVYWASGVEWMLRGVDLDPNGPIGINLYRVVNGALQSIVDPNSIEVDSNTRLVTFDSTLGGKVYLDTTTGSVRFSGAMINRSVQLYARFTPRYLRVSNAGGANYRGAALAFDDRFIGETSYWGNANNGRIGPTDPARNDRFVVTFQRTSTDGAQTARPFMRTLRFGIQLPTAVQTRPDGSLVQFEVSGMAPGTYYQVDPGRGRVYFMSENEDQTIQINYRGVDAAGQPYPNVLGVRTTVSPIFETIETPIPIEQAVNESAVAIALDPSNGPFNSGQVRRPGLLWLFWTSTRSGSPDLYFQTIAPRFTPIRSGVAPGE